jgi:hypothetical protein
VKGLLLRPSVVAATGLIGGFALARRTGRRELGGAAFAAAGAYCARRWASNAGALPAVALVGLYGAAMGGSHPLAKRIGAWPAVLGVTAAVAAASELTGRRALPASG